MGELDHQLFRILYGGDAPSPITLAVMIALTAVGSGWTMLGLVPLMAISRTRRLALALAATLLGTSALVFLVKSAVARARPCVALAGVHALFGSPTDPSFPSGHSAGSFAFAAFVVTVAFAPGRSLGKVTIAFGVFALATAIAVSRVYLGCHFPGDILGGALLGGLLGAAGARWHLARREIEQRTCSRPARRAKHDIAKRRAGEARELAREGDRRSPPG